MKLTPKQLAAVLKNRSKLLFALLSNDFVSASSAPIASIHPPNTIAAMVR